MQEGLSADFRLVFKVDAVESRVERAQNLALASWRGGKEEEFWRQFRAQAKNKERLQTDIPQLHKIIRTEFGGELHEQVKKLSKAPFNVPELTLAKKNVEAAWQEVSKRLLDLQQEVPSLEDRLRKEAGSLAGAFRDTPKQDELPRRRKQIDALLSELEASVLDDERGDPY